MKKLLYLVGYGLLTTTFLYGQDNCNVKYVDTQIGANNTRASNCVIGPQLPFGSINPSPQSVQPVKKNTSGYVPGELVMGFGQLHVSGTGGPGKFGHFLLSPQIGTAFVNAQHLSSIKVLASQPHYFKCKLEKYGIEAEISPTHHATIYQFTYPTSNEASIVLDATQSIPRDIFSPKG